MDAITDVIDKEPEPPSEDRENFWKLAELFGNPHLKPYETSATINYHVSGYDFQKEKREYQLYHELVKAFDVDNYVDKDTPYAELVYTQGGGELAKWKWSLSFTVAYWRKANQIHTWFVNEVQGGKDECEPHPVSRDKLLELRNICAHVLGKTQVEASDVHRGTRYSSEGIEELYEEGHVVTNAEIAQEFLPTRPGFFFGGTDYDDSYVWHLDNTLTQLDRALAMPDEWQFIYQSSW